MDMACDKASVREVLGFNDFWVLLFGIPVIAFSIPLLFFKATLANGLVAYLPEFTVSLVFTIAYWLTVRRIFIYLRRRFPGHRQVRQRVVYTLVFISIAFIIIHLVVGYLADTLIEHRHQPGVTKFDYAVGSFMIVLLVSSIYEGVYLYHRWRESIIEQERLRRENIESQLEGLRNQVNPHFLFNSLNTLVYIIPEDPDRAVKFVRKLSKVYRYVLETRNSPLVDLAEELRFLEAYLFLCRERFGDNLRVRIDLPDEVRHQQIVPLALELLFENAIKHNVISADHPLTIELFLDADERLVVRNNLQRKQQEVASTKVGLQNIRNRYVFFTDQMVDVAENGGYFHVAIPLLPAPATVMG